MYKVINNRTKKPIKNAITGKPIIFDSLEVAEKWARDCRRDSVLNASAFNSIRPTTFSVIKI